MSKEQIEEMARIIHKGELDRNTGVLDCTEFPTDLVVKIGLQRLAGAKALYNAGYTKQSENFIEVIRCCDCKYCEVVIDSIIDEPKCFCTRMVGSMPVDFTDYCSHGKMKGGAE